MVAPARAIEGAAADKLSESALQESEVESGKEAMKVIIQKVTMPNSKQMLFLSGPKARVYTRWPKNNDVAMEWQPMPFKCLEIPRDAIVEQWPPREEATA